MNIIIDMLKNHLYQDINDFLLNLLLVKYKARNAYLLESANFIKSEYSVFDMLNLSKTIGFLITKDITSLPNYPRYWISIEKLNKVPETDEEIGTLLGMKNPGGDYYNYKNKRLYLYINEEKTGVNITTELVLGNINDIDNKQFAINKINDFNEIMTNLNLPYIFTYDFSEDDGTIIRHNELSIKNIEYIKNNYNNYINDFLNILSIHQETDHIIITLFNRCLDNNKLLDKYISIFLYVYQVINEEILEFEDYKSKLEYINNKFIDLINN
jgi:hypothetical protein